MEDQPPPIITMGPANQTLPINTIAILPCQASGEPKPIIGWYRNGNQIIDNESSRMNVQKSGTLIIDSKLIKYTAETFCRFKHEILKLFRYNCNAFPLIF